MSDHRRHHYVPRFYLELFASKPGAVGVFAIESRKLVPQAPIKRQAYRKHFYGTDGRNEKMLGEIESNAAPVFARMIAEHRLPVNGSPEHQAVLFFLATQDCRTVRAEAQHAEGAEKSMKAFLRKQAELEGNAEILDALDRVIIKRKNVIGEALRAGAMGASLLTDLKMLLVINDSDVPFLASDAPVALHNRLFEHEAGCNTAGYGSVGLQIVLPLGPRVLLLCYDPVAYRTVGAVNDVLHFSADETGRMFNDLQWESAEALLFVSSETTRSALENDADRWEPLRGGDRTIFRFETVEETAERVRVRQGVGAPASTVKLDLPFLVERLATGRSLAPFEAAPLRDPLKMDIIVDLHERMSDMADALHNA